MTKRSKRAKQGYYQEGSAKSASGLDRRPTVGAEMSFSAAEAYKLLRTNLVFSMPNEYPCKIIGITSALKGEGKSTTSINLAYTIAEANQRVLYLEADMRLPVIAKILCLSGSPGLSNVLVGVCHLFEVVQSSTLLQNLYILPAGDIPPNPSELLSSPRFAQILEELSKSFDYIIIDLPPIISVSDSLAVSKYLHGMLLVVRRNYCDQHSLAEALRQLAFLNVKPLGFVLNDAEATGSRYHKYKYRKSGYGYGYGRKSAKKPEATGSN